MGWKWVAVWCAGLAVIGGGTSESDPQTPPETSPPLSLQAQFQQPVEYAEAPQIPRFPQDLASNRSIDD